MTTTQTHTRIAVIPAYEPGGNLLELLAEAQSRGFAEIVVVDDGSGPEYQEIFDTARAYANVISYPENKGKGAALKTAFAYIKGYYHAPHTIVTLDADGQHAIDDVIKVCEQSEAAPDALVLGCRDFSNAPKRSQAGNGSMRISFKLQTGVTLSDTQTGLRAFQYEMLEHMLQTEGNRYEYEMNMLLKATRNNVAIIEVPIKTIYLDDTNSNSHYSTIKDSILIGKELIKFSLSSFSSFLIDYVLYALLLAMLGTAYLTLSNIVARIVSATYNYTVNRIKVFKSDEPVLKTAIEYASLAVCILIINTVLLNFFVNIVGTDPYITKVIIELCLFVVNYIVQRTLIFAKKHTRK